MSDIRTPPHSTNAEKAVLGSLLLDNKCFPDVSHLSTDDFYHGPHRIMWSIATGLLRDNAPFDLVVLRHELKRMGKLEYVGDTPALRELPDIAATSKNAGHYAQIVKEKSTLRRLLWACERWVRDIYQAQKPDDLLTAMEQEFARASQGIHGDRGWEDIEAACQRVIDRLDSDVKPISTGLLDLDKKSGGLIPGELVIAAARPSMGKTALLTTILRDLVYAQGHTVALFSLEVGAEKWLSNLACNYGRVDTHKVRDRCMDAEEASRFMRAMGFITQYRERIHFCGTPDIAISSLRSRARQACRESPGLSVIAVDYLQLMGGDDKNVNRTQEVGVISRGLKKMATELGVCVVALAQLSRKVEDRPDRRPRMSDLRESGSIEQDADQIWMLYRPGYYDDKDNPAAQTYTELIVCKNRNGATGAVRLDFIPEYVRFQNSSGKLRDPSEDRPQRRRSAMGGYMPHGYA